MPPPLCSKLALFTDLLCAYFSVKAGMMQCIKPRAKTAPFQGVTSYQMYICGLEGNQCTGPKDLPLMHVLMHFQKWKLPLLAPSGIIL